MRCVYCCKGICVGGYVDEYFIGSLCFILFCCVLFVGVCVVLKIFWFFFLVIKFFVNFKYVDVVFYYEYDIVKFNGLSSLKIL